MTCVKAKRKMFRWHAARIIRRPACQPRPKRTDFLEMRRPILNLLIEDRPHQLVGPIFNEKIQDWPAHLEKIGSFWARLTGGPSNYSGGMPAKHFPLGLNASHFLAWLQLWEFNCHAHL